jgi:prepilin-type N-terminal cleavage/methylation domain-containing protein
MKNNRAFTLIELAIVLVVVALIVGAVVSASGLFDSSRRLKIIAGFDNYKKAFNDFYLKYNFLPGDMSYSQAKELGLLKPITTTPYSCYFNGVGERLSKANEGYYLGGNANGIIGDVVCSAESVYGWALLSYYGFINQTLKGASTFACSCISGNGGKALYNGNLYALGENLNMADMFPMGAEGNERFDIIPFENYHGIIYGIMPNKADPNSAFYEHPVVPASNPEEALSIDEKIDDGISSTGAVRSFSAPEMQYNCSYDVSVKEKSCNLIYSIKIGTN